MSNSNKTNEKNETNEKLNDKIPFIEFYLDFAKKDQNVKNIIRKNYIQLYIKNNKRKNKIERFSVKDYCKTFGYVEEVEDYKKNKGNIEIKDKHIKEQLNNIKKTFSTISKQLHYKMNDHYYKLHIPRFITINDKGYIKNINDRLHDAHILINTINKKTNVLKKVLHYLPNSIKSLTIKSITHYYVNIKNYHYNNLPNKLKILTNDKYPGITWREKIKIPMKTILVINFKKAKINYNNDEIFKYCLIKSFLTLIKYYDNDVDGFIIKEKTKEPITYVNETLKDFL